MLADISNPIFRDETKAREWLEETLWPAGPVCPHCGVLNKATKVQGKSARAGLYMCNACRAQFTVTVGTLMERSKIPLTKWLFATYLLMSSKKGMSTHQLHRMLRVSLKSTWFLMHRIREAMRQGSTPFSPLGGANKIVEADETYIGGKAANRKGKVPPKEAAIALVERDGAVRSFHVPAVNAKTLGPVLNAHIDRASYLMTDDARMYVPMGRAFAGHGAVNHSIEEYVRGDFWHTNTVENYFSILKRGINGTCHHVSQKHLKRYLAEFDSRYNERMGLGVGDADRTTKAIKGIIGKRLTYRRPHQGG